MRDHRNVLWLPELSIVHFGDGRPHPWAVTVPDYDSREDSDSIIAVFDTKDEAQAFILAEQRRQSATAPL